ncbi:MAG: hypothetical protein ACTHQM_20795 [Thermoanaerobaculia bacterium]
MNCDCSALPPIFDYEQRPFDFLRRLQEIDTGAFQRLFQCNACNQLWRIDDFDRLQAQFVTKLPSRENWQSFDSSMLEREFLYKPSDQPCSWANCPNRAVMGMAICAEHLKRSSP